MSKLLEQAINQLKTLPPEYQDAVARLILGEIEDEQNWDRSFSKSSDILGEMAETAMLEYQTGLTEELDPDQL